VGNTAAIQDCSIRRSTEIETNHRKETVKVLVQVKYRAHPIAGCHGKHPIFGHRPFGLTHFAYHPGRGSILSPLSAAVEMVRRCIKAAAGTRSRNATASQIAGHCSLWNALIPSQLTTQKESQSKIRIDAKKVMSLRMFIKKHTNSLAGRLDR
jgi:hypothetical protein